MWHSQGQRRGRERDIYLHASLSTAGRDNPQINMTFLQAQTCVHMGLCSGPTGESSCPPLAILLTHFVSQPVEINSPTGRSSKNNQGVAGGEGGQLWTWAKKSNIWAASAAAALGGTSKRTGCTPQSAPLPCLAINLITQKASKKPLAQSCIPPFNHSQ